jgi:hypothetical protein
VVGYVNSGDLATRSITRADYDTKGAEYLVEHTCANVFYPSGEPGVISSRGRRKKVKH